MQREAGFTLIELMVVIIILGVLATIVVPRFLGREEEARRTAAVVQISNFKGALSMFKLDNGFFPTTEQGLEALVEMPTIEPIPKRWPEGGYLERIPLDPWGNPYIYISPGIHSAEYDIISFGRDGKEGGEGQNADIRSWELETR
ncbi:type II secretion system major pseudopilin GspG [candidate division NPL-UPA2 bacterium]|nr:type II secretion system major pseudopilin GspG [candidate division NPL-UPA2 bacterium]